MHWHDPGPIRRPPGFIEPYLPTNGDAVPTGPLWVYEIKHDGFRFICFSSPRRAPKKLAKPIVPQRFPAYLSLGEHR
jgi:hypothetical protein